MRMILGISNKNIENKIANNYYYKYEIHIVKYSEQIIEKVQFEKEAVIIVKGEIKGKISFEEMICMLKKLNIKLHVIVIVKELSQKLKEFLFAKEIFSVIEGNKFELDNLIYLIENPQKIIYKNKSDTTKSNVIVVVGGHASGKTTATMLIAKSIAKYKNKKVLVLDLDFIYPTIDLYLGAKNYSLVDYIDDLKEGKIRNIENYETKDEKYNNLKYIVNAKSMCVPDSETIVRIIENLKQYYDYIVVDTSTIMLKKIYTISENQNYNIVRIIEPGKRAIKEYILDNNYIDKKSINNSIFLCNKCKSLKRSKYEYGMNLKNYIRFSYVFDMNIKEKYKFKYNINNMLKKIGCKNIGKLRQKIINKILEVEEE